MPGIMNLRTDDIRNTPELGTGPILAVSAAYPATALPEVQSRQFSGFISKPIRYNLFPGQVAEVIPGKSIWYTDIQV